MDMALIQNREAKTDNMSDKTLYMMEASVRERSIILALSPMHNVDRYCLINMFNIYI